MDEQTWLTVNDSTEGSYNLSSTLNSTDVPPKTSISPTSQLVSVQTVASVALVVVGIGICANSVVLAVLIRARRHAGNSVHTLIANQSAMNFVACVSGAISIVVMLTHGYVYNGNRLVDGAICVLFEGVASATLRKTNG